VIFVNLTSQDVAALYPQFLYEAILRTALNNSKLNFSVTTTPYPVTNFVKSNLKGTSPFFIVFFVSISFALIPAAMITFIMGEREKNLKHMQLISGMSLSAYWISNIIFDVLKSLIPCMVVLAFMKLYGLLYPNIWLSFLLYPIAITPFTYATSFLFSKETLAQTFTIFLHFVFGGIGPILTVVLRMIESTKLGGDKLNWVLKIIPSFCLTDTVAF
jgi:ATP-binding cassette subfamily A (ABC1) protein 3